MFFKLFTQRVANVLARDFIVAIISFFMTTYLANTLGTKQFGLWIGCLTFLMVCDLIFRLKIDQLVIYFSKKYPLGRNLYLKIVMLNFYSALIASVLIFIFKDIIISFLALMAIFFSINFLNFLFLYLEISYSTFF